MQTEHSFIQGDARYMENLEEESIHLVVTSPPYPMIEMWDGTFAWLNPEAGEALRRGDGRTAFELMHRELDRVWWRLFQLVAEGGFICINIGDATRKLGEEFRLYSNHARIMQKFWELGFTPLPLILWRKPTNAPTKFMGSGTLPAGAYVTLEHEYILIFRRGGKRRFPGEKDKENRRESAVFWEERNKWYSDLWDFKGSRQGIAADTPVVSSGKLRNRSGAYPFALPFRLINMYSLYGDTVLDPFLGLGTTSLAAMACGRNSLGLEVDNDLLSLLERKITTPSAVEELNCYQQERFENHLEFVREYRKTKGRLPGYNNSCHGIPVVSRQETGLKLRLVDKILQNTAGNYTVKYKEFMPRDSRCSFQE